MGIVNSNIEYPRVILNSVPKSGTHLMKQIIEGIPGMLSYPNKFYEGHSTDRDLHYRELQLVPKGHLVTGHVYYSTLWSDMLREMQFKHIFLNRDREILLFLIRTLLRTISLLIRFTLICFPSQAERSNIWLLSKEYSIFNIRVLPHGTVNSLDGLGKRTACRYILNSW